MMSWLSEEPLATFKRVEVALSKLSDHCGVNLEISVREVRVLNTPELSTGH